MYVLYNGQLMRPGAQDVSPNVPTTPTIKKKINSMVSNLSVRFKQILLALIILFIVYIFTCGKCVSILKLFR